jgi:hypothetical protein
MATSHVTDSEIALALGKSVANIKAFRALMKTKAFYVEMKQFHNYINSPVSRIDGYFTSLSGVRPNELLKYPLKFYERATHGN